MKVSNFVLLENAEGLSSVAKVNQCNDLIFNIENESRIAHRDQRHLVSNIDSEGSISIYILPSEFRRVRYETRCL